jgi:hypothetical protein
VKLTPLYGFPSQLRGFFFAATVFSIIALAATFVVSRVALGSGSDLTIVFLFLLIGGLTATAIWFHRAVKPNLTDSDRAWIARNSSFLGAALPGTLGGFSAFWLWRFLVFNSGLMTNDEFRVTGLWFGAAVAMLVNGFFVKGLDQNAAR